MFDGVALYGIKPVKSDIFTMSELMKNEMNECYLSEPYQSKVPKYISFSGTGIAALLVCAMLSFCNKLRFPLFESGCLFTVQSLEG